MAKKSQSDESGEKKRALYTITLTPEQVEKLRAWCDHRLWEFFDVDHAVFAAKGDQVNVVAYKSGKVVIQGKKTEDFVTYVVEGEITHEARMGYDEVHHPEWYEPHAGVDESGKGDFFGPVVSACVIAADSTTIRTWVEKGVKDSKRIGSDAEILKLDKMIRGTQGAVVKTTFAGMRKYNELYHKFGDNLNRLLAWMHATSVREALARQPVSWGMLDQFSEQPLVQRQLKDVPGFELKMQTKAEADPVVAAASIVARAEYVRQIEALSEKSGLELMKGASSLVKRQGQELVQRFGPDALGDYAKLHFRTAYEVLGLPVPEKKPFVRHGRPSADKIDE